MNIAFGFEIFYPEKNGIITATIDLAKALINKGHNVYFFIPDNGVIEGDTIEYGIKVCKLKGEKSNSQSTEQINNEEIIKSLDNMTKIITSFSL